MLPFAPENIGCRLPCQGELHLLSFRARAAVHPIAHSAQATGRFRSAQADVRFACRAEALRGLEARPQTRAPTLLRGRISVGCGASAPHTPMLITAGLRLTSSLARALQLRLGRQMAAQGRERRGSLPVRRGAPERVVNGATGSFRFFCGAHCGIVVLYGNLKSISYTPPLLTGRPLPPLLYA
jgi:hypothetical protein